MFWRVTGSCGACISEADGASCTALQSAMHRARILDEVESRPRISSEELGREEIAFQAITSAAGGDEIAGGVDATLGEREYVIDGGEVVVERRGAVDTAATAVTHHRVLDRALLVGAWRALGSFGPARDTWKTRETNAVIVSTTGQFHLAEKATPRNGSRSRSGASREA